MKTRTIAIFVSCLLWILPSLANEKQELKERFLKRKPVIDMLKNEGRLGENNLGLLLARGTLSDEEKTMLKEENADRQVVYQEIADKNQISIEEVGKRRAVKIAELAKPGHWLQHPEGHWYQKTERP